MSDTLALEDLDATALEVLEAAYEHGGEATTSDVKRFTGIEANSTVHYRFEKLAEAGLVEQDRKQTDDHFVPVRVIRISEEGSRQIAGGLFEEEQPTIVERMDRLESKFDLVLGELESLKHEFEQWKYDPEQDREVDVTDLLQKAEALNENLGGLTDEEIRGVMDVEGRVEALEDRFRIKGKWAGDHFPHVNRQKMLDRDANSWKQYEVDGYDLVMLGQAVYEEQGPDAGENLPELPDGAEREYNTHLPGEGGSSDSR